MARVCFSSISKAVEKFILDILKTCIQGWVNGCGTCKSLFLELRLYQNMDNHKNDVHVSMVNKRSKRGSVRGDGRMKYRRCRMVCIWPRGGVSRAWFVLIVWNNIPHPHVLEKRERERERMGWKSQSRLDQSFQSQQDQSADTQSQPCP